MAISLCLYQRNQRSFSCADAYAYDGKDALADGCNRQLQEQYSNSCRSNWQQLEGQNVINVMLKTTPKPHVAMAGCVVLGLRPSAFL